MRKFSPGDTKFKYLVLRLYLMLRKLMFWPFLLFRRPEELPDDNIRKILILRHDRIGDMVISAALFKALKSKFPAAYLTVLASERNREVIENNPNVDEVLVYRGLRWFRGEMKKRKTDLVIDLFYTHELKQAFLAYISGARYRMGFEVAGRELFFNLKGRKGNAKQDMLFNLLSLIGFHKTDSPGFYPEVFLKEEELSWAKKILDAKGIGKDLKIGIHPCAYYPSQRWPLEKFAELITRIRGEIGVKVLLFADKKETDLLRRIEKEYGLEIFCGLELRKFMALLSYCDLLVCNNSGPLHIASALKIPTVSTMGPTDPFLWWPQGEDNIVIRKGFVCSPCGRAICRKHFCMRQITVEEVLAAVKLQISNRQLKTRDKRLELKNAEKTYHYKIGKIESG